MNQKYSAIFADSIQIVTIFIEKFFKDSWKIKGVRTYVSKWEIYLYFLM